MGPRRAWSESRQRRQLTANPAQHDLEFPFVPGQGGAARSVAEQSDLRLRIGSPETIECRLAGGAALDMLDDGGGLGAGEGLVEEPVKGLERRTVGHHECALGRNHPVARAILACVAYGPENRGLAPGPELDPSISDQTLVDGCLGPFSACSPQA